MNGSYLATKYTLPETFSSIASARTVLAVLVVMVMVMVVVVTGTRRVTEPQVVMDVTNGNPSNELAFTWLSSCQTILL